MKSAAEIRHSPSKVPAREIFGWMMFDFANSSFTTVIVTVVFSAYFVSNVAGDKITGVKYWGWGLALSNLMIILFGPVLGAIADFSRAKKRLLFATYLVCVIFTALLFFVKKGDILLGFIIFLIANIGFSAGESFIAAFLPEIAEPEEMGKISGYGWAFGYVGGLLSLFMCLLIFRLWGQGELQIRSTFILASLFFLLSAVPTFLWLGERGKPGRLMEGRSYIRTGFERVRSTLYDLRKFGELIKFLSIFFLYSCGISIVVSFSAIYAEQVVGFSKSETLLFFVVVQVSSSVGAFIFGFVEDRIGAVKTITITLMIWIVVIVGAYWNPTRGTFWLVGNLAGLAIGSSQSSSRAMVALFSPLSKSAEFFGLWSLSAKLAATVGIYSYSLLTVFTGSMRSAILLALFFFLGGLLCINLVDEHEGKAAARNYDNSSRQ